MNPYVSVILTIAVCLLLFVLWIIYENYKNKKRILTKIRKNWGKPYTRQYEPGDIEQISRTRKVIKIINLPIFFNKTIGEVGANKAGTTKNCNTFQTCTSYYWVHSI